ncbi:MAG: VPS10 domain-containing protein [bacterium]
MKIKIIIKAGLASVLLFMWSTLLAQTDQELFKNMEARTIGPAGMSGRIADIEVVENNTDIIYVGSATGGLWKSKNGGVTWEPIFDNQPVSSIGAVSVYQKNPDIVYVGTGEGNPRNSVGVGYGIYKSVDGGESFEYMGLKNTQKIHRIIVHPENPDIVYAAAMGPTWKPHKERGIFKTTDGGENWEKILFVNELTGSADLVIDPENPEKLFAAMWEHRRWPWFFNSGGPGSGIYRTYDGGKNWTQITHEDGLPDNELGKCGLAIAQSNPDIVYAIIEAEKNCLARSEDGGHSWKIVNKEEGVNTRPFYYADIYVDTENENRIYSLQAPMKKSEDKGESFETMPGKIHSDFHAMWINPNDASHMLVGSDGGVGITHDKGETWRFVENLPLAQYYHISVDDQIPYKIYGGMQDNGSWAGPSSVWEDGGIRNSMWQEVGFGDGFGTLSDPDDPNKGYSMWQEGNLMRFDIETGERKQIRPAPPADSIELRFNWNTPLAISPFDPNVLYFGSQYVHKSTDKGDSWEVISPDLTTDNPEWQQQEKSGGLTIDATGAENFTTIFSLAPSPVDKNVLWAGTDDGNIQITRDGGENWSNVTDNIPGLPDNTWCSYIEASSFDSGTAYITFDDHRRGNWTTYVYKTENYGKTWKSLTQNDPTADNPNEEWGFAHVILQDYKDENLLFLGTEFGLFVSFDDGEQWIKWTSGVPTVPVRDMTIQEREDDLVIGTHGRAAIVLDNISPLRSIEKVKDKSFEVFDIPETYQHEIRQVRGYHFPADGIFQGENEPYGAMLSYYIHPELAEKIKEKKKDEEDKEDDKEKEGENSKEKGEVEIKIYNKDSAVVRTMHGKAGKGINRIYWDLKADGYESPSWEEKEDDWYTPPGPEVLTGEYIVEMTLEDHKGSSKATIMEDPRDPVPHENRQASYEALQKAGKEIEKAKEAVDKLKQMHTSIDEVIQKIEEKEDTTHQAVIEEGKKLQNKIEETARLFVSVPDERQGILSEKNIMRTYWRVTSALESTFDAPTENHKKLHKYARKELSKALEEYNKLFETEIKDFREKVIEIDPPVFPEYEKLEI